MTWIFRVLWLGCIVMLGYLSLTTNTAPADALRPDFLDQGNKAPGLSSPIPKDKLSHFFAFFVIGALTPPARIVGRGWFILSLIILLAYGYGLEYAQGAFTTRNYSLGDMAANALGAFSGLIVGTVFEWFRVTAVSMMRPRRQYQY